MQSASLSGRAESSDSGSVASMSWGTPVLQTCARGWGAAATSRLSASNGHVCQVSVAPEWQGRGLGRGLVERACQAFAAEGLTTASLSVTLANRRALQLYEQLGFRTCRAFAAHAWVRPPARLELPA